MCGIRGMGDGYWLISLVLPGVSFGCFVVQKNRSGLNRVDSRLLGRTDARLVFVVAGEVALLLVTQAGCRFLDGGAIAQQLMGVALALFLQPVPGIFAHVPEKVSVQGAHRDTA